MILLQLSQQFTRLKLGGESLHHILWCAGIILAVLLLKRPLALLVARIFAGIANRFTDKNHGKHFRELLQRPLELLLGTLLFYVAVNQLTYLLSLEIFRRQIRGRLALVVRISDIADKAFLLFIILFTTLVLSRVIDFIFYTLIEKAYEEDNKEKEQLFPLIKDVGKIVLWTIGAFWVLGTVFSVNIPALITGLGIGGVAIALAAKESVENFFASFIILTDKPFQSGDRIKLDKYEGKVERVGFRSTRLRSMEGSLYIIPNKKLIGENLENLTQRDTTRIRVVMNIKYGLPAEQLDLMTDELRYMLKSTTYVTGQTDVFLESFNENVFQLILSYYLPDPMPDGESPASVKQKVNMGVYRIITRYTDAIPAAISSPVKEEEDTREEKKDDPDKII